MWKREFSKGSSIFNLHLIWSRGSSGETVIMLRTEAGVISRRQNSVVILSLSAVFRVTGTYASWQQLLKIVVTKQPKGTYCSVVTAVSIFADNKLFLW